MLGFSLSLWVYKVADTFQEYKFIEKSNGMQREVQMLVKQETDQLKLDETD